MARHISNIAKRSIVTGLLAGSLAIVCTQDASAGTWMFRRSYYSHVLPPDVAANYPQPESRSAFRRAVPSPNPSFSVRGGYRYNTINIRGRWQQPRLHCRTRILVRTEAVMPVANESCVI